MSVICLGEFGTLIDSMCVMHFVIFPTVDRVDVISVTTSTKSVPKEIEEDGAPIIKKPMTNNSG